MSLRPQQKQQTATYATMPCGFEEEFVDFESAASQYSCAAEEWSISELDDEALGIVDDTRGGNNTGEGGGESKSGASTTGIENRDEVLHPGPISSGGMKLLSSCNGDSNAASSHSTSSEDDLFSPRSYGSSFCKTRPTMISAKYRLKEERRKVLKISINKLKKIEDPESSLRRSVLINNTMKRLQKEAREEKLHKQQLHSYPSSRCYSSSSPSFGIKEDSRSDPDDLPSLMSQDLSSPSLDADKENTSPFTTSTPSFDAGTTTMTTTTTTTSGKASSTTTTASPCEDFAKTAADVSPRLVEPDCLCEESMDDLVVDVTETDNSLTIPGMDDTNLTGTLASSATSSALDVSSSVPANRCSSAFASRKRSFDEVEDCDVHDVLSQFYMPPTPRMLTSIDDTDDEDEDVNVVDIDIVTTPDLELPEVKAATSTSQPSSSVTSSPLPPTSCSSVSSSLLEDQITSTSCKRPRFDTDDLVIDVDPVKELQLCTANPLSQDSSCIVPSPTRTAVHTSDMVNCSVINSTSVDLDDQEDIEVVLEDNEDVQRRLLLCGATSASSTALTRTTPSPPCWASASSDAGVRTSTSVASVVTSADTIEGSHSHLRFSNSLSPENKTTVMSGCSAGGAYCGNNGTVTSGSSVMMDTSDQHQYSCGHSSIFGELQSVVFHSLIASLES